MTSVFALADVNNCFVSCERIFKPFLENKPVVVLSNNDGCAIARSEEAKQLGIKMGEPYFKFKHLKKKHPLYVFSSNFALYGDMSKRFNEVLRLFSSRIEIYSIDEAFLDLSHLESLQVSSHCLDIRHTVKKWLGLPICIGIGSSKTLAKAANYLAKKDYGREGVVNLLDSRTRDFLLKQIPIEEVWGIGRQWSKKLMAMNIQNAFALSRLPARQTRKKFNVFIERLILELNGEACFALETQSKPNKQIQISRSFKDILFDFEQIKARLVAYVTRASEKLRSQQLLSQQIFIFLSTSRFVEESQYYKQSLTVCLPIASDDTRLLIQYACLGLKKIFKPGFEYKKTGVILQNLSCKHHTQLDFLANNDSVQSTHLMNTLDHINQAFGRDMLRPASSKPTTQKIPLPLNRSKACTTRWEALPTAT